MLNIYKKSNVIQNIFRGQQQVTEHVTDVLVTSTNIFWTENKKKYIILFWLEKNPD